MTKVFIIAVMVGLASVSSVNAADPPRPKDVGDPVAICASEGRPANSVVSFVRTNRLCGTGVENQWWVTDISSAPVGATRKACKFAGFPDGWEIVDRDPTSHCGPSHALEPDAHLVLKRLPPTR